MKLKDGPYLAKAQAVADELGIIGELGISKEAKDNFLDVLIDEMESRLQNTESTNSLSALNLSQVPPDSVTFHGDHQVTQMAELFKLDVDETLFQWNEFKEMSRDELPNCFKSWQPKNQLLETCMLT